MLFLCRLAIYLGKKGQKKKREIIICLFRSKATKNGKIALFMTIFSIFLFFSSIDVFKENIFLGFVCALIGGGMVGVTNTKHPNWKGYPWT